MYQNKWQKVANTNFVLNSFNAIPFLLSAMLLVSIPSPLAASPWYTKLNVKQDKVIVVAHRACWRLAPENSIASVQSCIKNHVDMVEIDVQKSKDGQLVAVHDKTLDRTTNGTGAVSDYTLAQLKSLKLKARDGGEEAPLTNERIPTLKELLQVSQDKILVNIDAKADIRDEAYLVAKELGITQQILIKKEISSTEYSLQHHAFYGQVHFMPIIREQNGAMVSIIESFNADVPLAYEVIYTKEQSLKTACIAAKKQGAACWLNTLWESLSPGHSDDIAVLAPDSHWGYLVQELGVNIIQTDRPVALVKYLQSKGRH